MISFCGNSSNLSNIWVDHGFSLCFFNTVSASILLLMGLIPLPILIHNMRRNATVVNVKCRTHNSAFYILQWISIAVLTLETLIRFFLDTSQISGVAIYSFIARMLLLSMTTALFRFERTKVFMSSSSKGHSWPLVLSWSFLLIFDTVAVVSWNSILWWFRRQSDADVIKFTLWITRLLSSCLLLVITLCYPAVPIMGSWVNIQDEEEGNGADRNEQWRSTSIRQHTGSTWGGFKRKMKLVWPYMWPTGKPLLQLNVIICIGCLVAGRIVNLFVPIYYKNIVNTLTSDKSWGLVLHQIGVYAALKFLQGDGFLNAIQSYLWCMVGQFTHGRAETNLFAHMHTLSHHWHLSRKTGEVLRSIDRGKDSINLFLSYFLFQIAPTFADIMVAVIYFATYFSAWFGLLVFVCISLYIAATVLLTEWRTKYRRAMNTKCNSAKQVVKYYGAEKYEVKKYNDAIDVRQEYWFKSSAALILLKTSQNVIINTGLILGSLLCAKRVLDGTFQVGDFVLFGTYMMQLYTPLHYFGVYFEIIQTGFIDMENIFDIFDGEQEVVDDPNAATLDVSDKTVEFENVCFHYQPEKPILKNVSFKVNQGETIALVGPSGSGKSTIIRLLFRFYDIQSGLIKIDGTDISKVSLNSLRKYIGVVPQDTVLFNDNIRKNIRYGRATANDEQVADAARAADIHDEIESFPDKYETMVGERGLKLSGGEKQRVAIARTLLKDPDFVLLDGTTSCLDVTTERNIQASLNQICAGRTTIVVAHRLSTIKNADCILVLQDGEIVERGSHYELLNLNGVYSGMWMQQLADVHGENTTSGQAV